MLLHLPRMEGHGAGPAIKNGPALAGHGAEAMRDTITRTISSHTARTAGRLRFGDFLVSYERFEVLDAVGGEGHNAVFVL